MDSNKTIFKAAARFFSGTALSRVTGLLRDMAMAYSFGTSASLAAFFTAFRLTNVPRRLLGEGGMQTAFIPHFEKLKSQDPKRALNFFRDLHTFLSLLLLVLITLVMGSLGALLQWGNLTEGNQEIVWMTFLMLPGLLFICLYGLNSALLECEGSYFTPSIAPIAFNAVWIMAALLTSTMSFLSLALILASVGQWAITLPKTLRFLKGSLFRDWRFFSPDLRLLMKPLFLANLGIVATQVNSALDPLFARFAHPEGPAWLWYAIRIEQLPLALFGIALSGALLPPLSRAAKNQDLTKFQQFLTAALKKSSYLMIPITLGIFVLGGWSVKLLFGRGDFGPESIAGTSLCLTGYAIGLLPQTWILILAPAYYALSDYKTPAQAAALSVLFNLFFNALFVFIFHWGPESVAIATSLATFFNFFYLLYFFRKKFELSLQEAS